MIKIVVEIKPKKDLYDEYLTKCKKLALESLNESGCLEYKIIEDVESFRLFEVYEDDNALQLHKNKDYFLEWRESVKDLGVRNTLHNFKIKTFEDLNFLPCRDGVKACLPFYNCYGASVMKGDFTLLRSKDNYQLEILKWSNNKWSVCHFKPFIHENNIHGYSSTQHITNIMRIIQDINLI